ncbi:MAG: Fur family transcriptional regulator [Anaerolineae bacterium]
MTEPLEARLDRLSRRLRAAGGRVTSERLAILRVLAADESHPSADTIYRRVVAELPSISLATVYKTLATLQRMGEVLELTAVRGESRYDGLRPEPHPHLICARCSNVANLALEDVEALLRLAALPARQWTLTARVDFWGYCPQCCAEVSGDARPE